MGKTNKLVVGSLVKVQMRCEVLRHISNFRRCVFLNIHIRNMTIFGYALRLLQNHFVQTHLKKKGKKKLMVTTHCTMKRPTTHTRIFLKKILALQFIYSYNKRYKLILSFSWKKKEDFWHINFPCQNRTNLFHTKGFSVAADDWIHLLQPLHFGGLCPRIHSSWKDASELWWWQQY